MQNVRELPLTNLDGEINAPFLLHEHGDPYFLFHHFAFSISSSCNNAYQVSLEIYAGFFNYSIT